MYGRRGLNLHECIVQTVREGKIGWGIQVITETSTMETRGEGCGKIAAFINNPHAQCSKGVTYFRIMRQKVGYKVFFRDLRYWYCGQVGVGIIPGEGW